MHLRFIVPSTTLAFLIGAAVSGQAQPPNMGQPPERPQFADPFDMIYQSHQFPDIQETPARSEMERAIQQAERAGQSRSYIPRPGQPEPESNAVSVAQLKHPLSRKGMKLISKVQSYLKRGERAKAKEQLSEALKEPSAAPYAHAILGTEYLRDGQPAAAVPELETAAQVLPVGGVHSNLGYALCLTGHMNRGLMELTEALQLNGDSPQTRFLIGVVLLNQKTDPKKAEYNLKLAENRVPTAHLALAICDILNGEKDAAEEQVHQYLGSDQADFPMIWHWAIKAAAIAHPAAAFGFNDHESD